MQSVLHDQLTEADGYLCNLNIIHMDVNFELLFYFGIDFFFVKKLWFDLFLVFFGINSNMQSFYSKM